MQRPGGGGHGYSRNYFAKKRGKAWRGPARAWRLIRVFRKSGHRFCDQNTRKSFPQAGRERQSFADRPMNDAGAPSNQPDSADQGGFDIGGQPSEVPGAGKPYRVLARKYRPSSFDDLIGQEAMVRTVSNAFETGRIPQAWILTGVRGVGKTTTARILARALNYEKQDGSVKGPTIHMPDLGVHCQPITESRHQEVLEMDAASHTGVDDIRQINDSVRYAPASARYKVYIIDEVHMLSTAAFNAFLKTLE